MKINRIQLQPKILPLKKQRIGSERLKFIFCFFLYLIYSIWSIRKSLKQHVFTNSEAATGDVLRKNVFLETSP